MNPYQIIEVSEKASPYVIRAAWAALVRECHPDGPKPDAKRTRLLNEAYAVLKDPTKREELDKALKTARVQEKKPGHFGKVGTENVVPAYPPAYMDAYMGVNQEDIDKALDEMTKKMGIPPAFRRIVNVAHRAARGRA